jgi:AmmeMemoRadiSam system protein B
LEEWESWDEVRAPAVAGTFYPSDPDRLRREMDELLAMAEPVPLAGSPIALVVPHAGTMFSGAVAAAGYRQLAAAEVQRVFLIGPSHRLAFGGAAAWAGAAFATPLGEVPLDRAVLAELLTAGPEVIAVKNPAHDDEHALEVELPFLQRWLGRFTLVPLLMGKQDAATSARLAQVLARVVRPEAGDLVIASSDLSHYHSYAQAVALDRLALARLADLDPEGWLKGLAEGRFEACGGGPIGVALLCARWLGGREAVVLRYQNSGDVTGDFEQVVGYAACAVS